MGQKEKRETNRAKVNAYLGGKCQRCGKGPDEVELHTHHRDPGTKAFNVGERLYLDFERLLPELDKCILLCIGCHISHHGLKPLIHGNYTNVSEGRCKCEICLASKREVDRVYRASARGRETRAANQENANRLERKRRDQNKDEINRRNRERRAQRKVKKDLSTPTQK